MRRGPAPTRSTSPPQVGSRLAKPNDPGRRQRIAQAAIEVAATQGLDRVTHRAVAATAGVPLGSMTYHFSGRDDLIEAALREAADRHVEAMRVWERELPSDADLPAALAELVLSQHREADRDAVVVGYDLYVAALHRPQLRPISATWDDEIAAVFSARTDPVTGHAVSALVCGLVLQIGVSDVAPSTAEIEALFRRVLGES